MIQVNLVIIFFGNLVVFCYSPEYGDSGDSGTFGEFGDNSYSCEYGDPGDSG